MTGISNEAPFNDTGVNGAGSSLAKADDFMGLAGSSRSLLRLLMSPENTSVKKKYSTYTTRHTSYATYKAQLQCKTKLLHHFPRTKKQPRHQIAVHVLQDLKFWSTVK